MISKMPCEQKASLIKCQFMKHKSCISLVGMPGAGKSTVGVLLAKTLAKDFVDTDVLIQIRSGQTLQAIVDQQGYLRLRELEEQVLLELETENSVIATGGSAVYSHDGMAQLKKLGTVIYLQLPFTVVEQRITNIGSRGLARKADQSLEDLYRERTPLYERYADHCVDANQPPEEVIRTIEQALSNG